MNHKYSTYIVIGMMFIALMFGVMASFTSDDLNELCGGSGDTAVKVDGTWICQDQTGWIEYIDTEYNNTNRFTASTSRIAFPNNAGNNRSLEKPSDFNVNDWYNGTHILAKKEGDGIILRIRFISEPQDNNLYCELTNDIGLGNNLTVRNINFPKGLGVEQIQSFTNFEYQLSSWKNNGGKLYIECSGDVEIWNIEYTIAYAHRGRGTY